MTALGLTSIAVTLVASMAGVGSASLHPTGTDAAAKSPARLVTARLLKPRPYAQKLRPGARIPAAEVSARSFANPRDGFGLAVDSDYPARTLDGGRSWTIDGPVFHIPAADGPEAVEFTGIVSKRTEFAYGSSVVDVTTNGGRTWWEAFVGEEVIDVTFQSNELIAVVQNQTPSTGVKLITSVYVSKDGGRHWHYDDTWVP